MAKKRTTKRKIQEQNKDRQESYKSRQAKLGFYPRTYYVHESKMERVKAYIQKQNKQAEE